MQEEAPLIHFGTVVRQDANTEDKIGTETVRLLFKIPGQPLGALLRELPAVKSE